VCILSTFNDGGYSVESGTSSSAPMVTGVVAQCVSAGPCRGLTPAQTIARIVADARRYNDAHPAYGYDGDQRHEHGGRHYGDVAYAGRFCLAPATPLQADQPACWRSAKEPMFAQRPPRTLNRRAMRSSP